MINLDFSLAITILYVVILYVFMDRVFFRPVMGVLQKRRDLIQGQLEDARTRIEMVENKTAEYEQALKAARAEAYRQQEIDREQALGDKAALIGRARSEAEKAIQEGSERLTREAEAARHKLKTEVDEMAAKLTTIILRD